MKVVGLLLSGVGAGCTAARGEYECVPFAVLFVVLLVQAVRR